MSAIIRFRKATDRKFFSLRADQIKAVEDTVGTLTEGGEQQDVVVLITELGNIPVDESSNKVLGLLEEAGQTVIK
ncbi:hypothetical protein PP747_gp056 [Rhizobium phage RHph_Y38]|uniref:Uncharacterized protein n=2 Tax=Acanvirus TaxID=3044653 RepID=A0A7S5QX84_9CAUD|nr:hypothetical protein PP747_gp056 [Rhizobium phage RHph_Y38]YP_010658264.1 hypothetical protein PP749_gp053 [Rhizobium phage RHEph22]QIG67757.1 hypothetical protein EVB52_056 [Rhizobium phage RHph_Y38]QXV74726.1 hypothetical protein [Rhizobium phage RHEph22]QXV74821.1 hypothetical protein [Rhizobium phage RHEph24]